MIGVRTGIALLFGLVACDRGGDASEPMKPAEPAPAAEPVSEANAAAKVEAAPEDAGATADEPAMEIAAGAPTIVLPRVATPLDPLFPSTRIVRVGTDAIALRGKEIVPLDAGALPAEHRAEDHAIVALHEALKAAPAIKEPHLALEADVETPAATVLDVLHTMGPHAFGEIGLVAQGSDGNRGVVPLRDVALGEPRDDPSADAPALVATIDGGGFVLWDMGEQYPEGERLGVRTAGGVDPYAAWDFGALTDRSRELAGAYTKAGEAALSPDPDVPWAVVLRAIVAMRGPDCAAGTCIRPHAVLIASGEIARGRADVEPLGGSPARPSIPKIKVPAATVGPSGDKEVIRRVVRTHISEVKTCYENGLARDPALAGKVIVEFTIAADGTVAVATVAPGGTLTDTAVQSCITRAVKSWTFPAPSGGGILKIKYPFVFTPSP